MNLPEGLAARPLRITDAPAVCAVMAAQELLDAGEVLIDEESITGDWQRPSFDISASTMGVFDGDILVAYAEYAGGTYGDAAVHPDYRGRGLGTQLAQWMQQTARTAGAPRVGMPVPAGSPGQALLESLGYERVWISWALQLPPEVTIETAPLPDGYRIREAEPAEYHDIYNVFEDAFLEWSVRERANYDDWTARTYRRPNFEPWNVRVALDPAGHVVGSAFIIISGDCGFLEKLAVQRDRRNLGLARALLADAFEEARAHGATVSELTTDSRTGALSLYEKVGMVVTSNWYHYAIEL